MAATVLNLRIQPRRMLPAREAADYCGIRATKRFAEMCGVAPVEMPDGSKLYDMRDLDAWIDGIKGGDEAADDDILGRLR